MDIEEVVENKKELEANIVSIIKEFELKTGVRINDIELRIVDISILNGKSYIEPQIEITINL